MAALCAELRRRYHIPLSRKAAPAHADMQPALGMAQRGKWDVTWLPGLSGPGAPLAVGAMLRARMLAELAPAASCSPPNRAVSTHEPRCPS